jgi:hypothetical protein
MHKIYKTVFLTVVIQFLFISSFYLFSDLQKCFSAVYDSYAEEAIANGWETLPDSFAWGEGTGWIDFTSTSSNRIYIADNALWGYAYGGSIGWISLNCNNGSSCSYVYKVANDGQGRLSGYAWGENIGWVDFGSTDFNNRTWGVYIDENGIFRGSAYSENAGWITFYSENNSVTTNWRPAPVLPSVITSNNIGVGSAILITDTRSVSDTSTTTLLVSTTTEDKDIINESNIVQDIANESLIDEQEETTKNITQDVREEESKSITVSSTSPTYTETSSSSQNINETSSTSEHLVDDIDIQDVSDFNYIWFVLLFLLLTIFIVGKIVFKI